MCVKDRASHTGYTFYGCVPLAKMLKQPALFLGGYVNKDLKNFLVALVIFKCFVVVSPWLVVLCCDEMLSLAEFKVELIMVQRRAGQGQRQATHNKHIPGSFTCYASQEACFTQAAGLCGRMGHIFLLYQARHGSQPPTYQTRHICLRHLPEKPSPPTSFPSLCPLTPTPLAIHHHSTPLLCSSSHGCPSWELMS